MAFLLNFQEQGVSGKN